VQHQLPVTTPIPLPQTSGSAAIAHASSNNHAPDLSAGLGPQGEEVLPARTGSVPSLAYINSNFINSARYTCKISSNNKTRRPGG
jgi:hypothetical protein